MDPLILRTTAENSNWIHFYLALTDSWLCAVRWEIDAFQCLSDLEAPILQAYLSCEKEQPLGVVDLYGQQQCFRAGSRTSLED